MPDICRLLGLSRSLVHYFVRGRPRRWRIQCLACSAVIESAAALPAHQGTVYCSGCLHQPPQMLFATWLRSHRLAAGLSIVAFARLSGIAEASIGLLERRPCCTVRRTTVRN